MPSPQLHTLEFELAYLALLTRSGIKPLSRWEQGLALKERRALESLGLLVKVAHRSVQSGREIEETIFSRAEACLEHYLGRFDGRPLDRSFQTQRAEGLLFGYPPCCVELFIREGYAANGLCPDDQKILFHWACPGCRATPLLLPQYRIVYDECCRIFDLQSGFAEASILRSHFRRGTVLAASLAMLASGTGITLSPAKAQTTHSRASISFSTRSKLPVDPHLIPLPPEIDADQDYLSDDEEEHTGFFPRVADSDSDGVIDGIQCATELWGLVEALPHEISDAEPYRQDVLMYGLETCTTCGEIVNMGFVQVSNPQMKLALDIPFIGLHYMEHGGFSYSGDIHTGRVNIPLLRAILKSEPDVHWLAVDGDTDGDGLADDEEAYFGMDAGAVDADSDGVYDGVALAAGMRTAIEALPDSESSDETYLIEHLQRGIETCDRCGEVVNMGYVEITNPLEALSMEIPFIGLHYLDHGSFSWSGNLHQGRANVRLLETILKSRGRAHVLPVPGDSDQDGLTDDEEAFFGSIPGQSDSDGNGIPDGVQLAQAMWSAIGGLDTTASQTEPYRIEHIVKGIVMCPVCGLWVNMGYIEIVNVPRDLRHEISYLALHFMEHGSYAYGREGGRVSPIETIRALTIPVKGDINGDGLIDVRDVISMVNFILGHEKPDPGQMWAADMNGDGRIDVLDVVQAIRTILG